MWAVLKEKKFCFFVFFVLRRGSRVPGTVLCALMYILYTETLELRVSEMSALKWLMNGLMIKLTFVIHCLMHLMFIQCFCSSNSGFVPTTTLLHAKETHRVMFNHLFHNVSYVYSLTRSTGRRLSAVISPSTLKKMGVRVCSPPQTTGISLSMQL